MSEPLSKQSTAAESGRAKSLRNLVQVGRPLGSRNRNSGKAAQIFHDSTVKVVKAIVKKALDGDVAAQKICIDRILPTLYEQHRMVIGSITAEHLGQFLNLMLGAVRETKSLSADQIIDIRDNMQKLLPTLAVSFAGAQDILRTLAEDSEDGSQDDQDPKSEAAE